MSFLDKVGNKVDRMKSKQSENSDVSSYNKQIKEEKNAIDALIIEVGNYYWNRYLNDNLTPSEDIAGVFEEIKSRVDNVNALEQKIEDRRVEGQNQRIEIDKNTQAIEERKAAEAAERKRQKEEAKRLAAEQKAAEEAAKEVTSEEENEE